MNAYLFMLRFIEIQKRFDRACHNHLNTPWWRFFKAERHHREMQQATKDLEALGYELRANNKLR